MLGLYRNQHPSGVPAEPLQKPEDQEDRGEKDGAQGPGNQHQEDPVSPRLPPLLFQMPNDQRIVAPVRLPGDVKGIAQQRNRPQQYLDANVDHHSDQRDIGHTPYPRRYNEDRRSKAADNIAQAGDETDDAIQSEADGGAGDAEPFVEYVGKQVEIFIREEAARLLETRRWPRLSRRKNLGLTAARHRQKTLPVEGVEGSSELLGAQIRMLQSKSIWRL
jgi:hypothetical protein